MNQMVNPRAEWISDGHVKKTRWVNDVTLAKETQLKTWKYSVKY